MVLNVEEAKELLRLIAKCNRSQLQDLHKQISQHLEK